MRKNVIELKYKDLLDPGVKESALYFLEAYDFPVLFSHQVSKICQFIISELDQIELIRNKLVKKYGQEDPETKTFFIIKDTPEEQEYVKEFMKFLEENITCTLVKLNLVDIADYKIKPKHLKNMDKFFIR